MQQKINYLNKDNFIVAYAIRQYLQVLMGAGRPQRTPKNWERIANRVVEIVRYLGFLDQETYTCIFSEFFSDGFDLWAPFCSYTNLFPDSLFDDFFDRCIHLIPLDQLFVLIECSTVIGRTERLLKTVAQNLSLKTEDLGLSSIEKAFISACDSNQMAIASELISAANVILEKNHIANNPNFPRFQKTWLSYEYKFQLLNLLDTLENDPDKFAQKARELKKPYDQRNKKNEEGSRQLEHECQYYLRYITAAAYCQTDPSKCVNIMEALYNETKNTNHSFMLFKGRIALYEIDENSAELRRALSQFLTSASEIEPSDMLTLWISTILNAYKQLNDVSEMDEFWRKLTQDQQARIEILHPYCSALIARGEPLIAQQIVNRYVELNQKYSEHLGLNDLIDELAKALPNESSISQLVHIIEEKPLRSNQQLGKDYCQIVSKEFKDYVAIVSPTTEPHEFLKNRVLEVVDELLLRLKNLQIHDTKTKNGTSSRITQEDLINDWFTSLFDKRMAEAHIGLRDQKRGGQSASGKNPGEIDGFITDGQNRRIAIFEAFRLFSADTNTITEHLNKISGYDNEALSPVFIVAYCDVADFTSLTKNYKDFITSTHYAGYSVDSGATHKVNTISDIDQLWVGSEHRRRHSKDIIFYHILLDMKLRD